MSRLGAISLDFADGTYAFRLPWKQLIELQEKCDAGPFVVFDRLRSGSWHLQDIRETIRLGLIGGDTDPPRALSMVRAYVEERPLAENVLLAIEILGAAILGVGDETVGEQDAANQAGNRSTTSPGGSSDLPPSTQMAP